MESGEVRISNTGDDGIQAAFKDDTNRAPEEPFSLSEAGTLIQTKAVLHRRL